ncbi:hypothetical protein [Mycobacterium simulans]|nr:hypothetical protein [Mycobacterium simulans]
MVTVAPASPVPVSVVPAGLGGHTGDGGKGGVPGGADGQPGVNGRPD